MMDKRLQEILSRNSCNFMKKWILIFCHFFIFLNTLTSQKNLLFVGDSYTSVNDLQGSFCSLCKIKQKDVNCFSSTYDDTNWNNQILETRYYNEINYIIQKNKIDLIIFQSISLLQPNSYSDISNALNKFRINHPNLPILICNDFNTDNSFPIYFCSKSNFNMEINCNIFKNGQELNEFKSNVINNLIKKFSRIEFCDNNFKRGAIEALIGKNALQIDEQGHPSRLLQYIKAFWIFKCVFDNKLNHLELTQFLKTVISDEEIIKKIITTCN